MSIRVEVDITSNRKLNLNQENKGKTSTVPKIGKIVNRTYV